MKTKQLKISECFYSIQGEGYTAGKPAYFLRLADCNILCGGSGTIRDKKLHSGAKWRCDSIEVWKVGERFDNQQIIDKFDPYFIHNLKNGIANLVITGGEPLLQMDALNSFLGEVMIQTDFRAFIELETNGTIEPDTQIAGFVKLWNVSPKLSNSGVQQRLRINNKAIKAFNILSAIYKFVVVDEDDIEEMEWEWIQRIRPETKIYLMPGVDNKNDYSKISQWVIEKCKQRGYLYGSRLQIAIYDQKTGV